MVIVVVVLQASWSWLPLLFVGVVLGVCGVAGFVVLPCLLVLVCSHLYVAVVMPTNIAASYFAFLASLLVLSCHVSGCEFSCTLIRVERGTCALLLHTDHTAAYPTSDLWCKKDR